MKQMPYLYQPEALKSFISILTGVEDFLRANLSNATNNLQ